MGHVCCKYDRDDDRDKALGTEPTDRARQDYNLSSVPFPQMMNGGTHEVVSPSWYFLPLLSISCTGESAANPVTSLCWPVETDAELSDPVLSSESSSPKSISFICLSKWSISALRRTLGRL